MLSNLVNTVRAHRSDHRRRVLLARAGLVPDQAAPAGIRSCRRGHRDRIPPLGGAGQAGRRAGRHTARVPDRDRLAGAADADPARAAPTEERENSFPAAVCGVGGRLRHRDDHRVRHPRLLPAQLYGEAFRPTYERLCPRPASCGRPVPLIGLAVYLSTTLTRWSPRPCRSAWSSCSAGGPGSERPAGCCARAPNGPRTPPMSSWPACPRSAVHSGMMARPRVRRCGRPFWTAVRSRSRSRPGWRPGGR